MTTHFNSVAVRPRIEFVALLATIAIPLGCRKLERVGPESTGVAVAALEATTLSPPFELEAPPPTSPENSFAMAACGPSVCLVAQSVYREWFPASSTKLRRVSHTGTFVDPKWLDLEQQTVRAVVATGADFLVVTHSSATLTDAAFRVSGTDGTILADVSAKLPPDVSSITSDGAHLYIVYVDSGVLGRVYDAATLDPIGPPVALPSRPDATVAGNGQFLILWRTSFVRVSATTGSWLDAAPVVFGQFLDVRALDATYVGGRYVVGLIASKLDASNPGTIYSVRIDPDGTVLDADDTFNMLTGARAVCTQCGGVAGSPYDDPISMGSRAGAAWLVFSARATTLGAVHVHALRVDPSTGLALESDLDLGTSSSNVLAQVGADGGFLLNSDSSRGMLSELAITDAPFSVSRGTDHFLAGLGAPRRTPAVASNRSDFLVTWLVQGELVATRVDGTTGAYLDSPPIDVGAADAHAVGSDGTDYLVAFTTAESNGSTTLHRRVIRADGSITTDATIPNIAYAANQTAARLNVDELHVASNGSVYVVAWGWGPETSILRGISARRFDGDGLSLDATDLAITNSRSYAFAIATDHPVNPAMGSCLAAYIVDPSTATLRRVRTQLGSVITPTTTLDAGNSGGSFHIVGAASGGTDLAVAWGQGSEEWIGFVDPSTGLAIGSPRSAGGILPYSSLEHDGVAYISVGQGYYENHHQLFARRFASGDLAPLDSSLGSFGRKITDLQQAPGLLRGEAAFASSSNGRSLVVYLEGSEERQLWRIVGRFYDHGGLPSQPPQVDAGVPAVDAGTSSDAGVSLDAGTSLDSGTNVVDASNTSDSGAIPADDGGVEPPRRRSGGCALGSGASTASPRGALIFVAVVCLLRAVRRRIATRDAAASAPHR